MDSVVAEAMSAIDEDSATIEQHWRYPAVAMPAKDIKSVSFSAGVFLNIWTRLESIIDHLLFRSQWRDPSGRAWCCSYNDTNDYDLAITETKGRGDQGARKQYVEPRALAPPLRPRPQVGSNNVKCSYIDSFKDSDDEEQGSRESSNTIRRLEESGAPLHPRPQVGSNNNKHSYMDSFKGNEDGDSEGEQANHRRRRDPELKSYPHPPQSRTPTHYAK